MRVNILGIKIDDVSLNEATITVESWVKSDKKHYIVTPNPEFLVLAQDDSEFKKVLNEADLAIPDGVGLKLTGKIKNRVAGVDLMEKLIEISTEKDYSIGFLGGKPGIAKKCAEVLKQKYPTLKVLYAESGGTIDNKGEGIDENVCKLDILFVGFGQIKQEKWIFNNLNKHPVKVMMGVGGSLDFISGLTPRAPKFVRDIGFEWLFRLIIQPWRLKRQLSLVKFIYLLLKGGN